MPILRILCHNGSLVIWTVVSLTTAKFKSLIFSISGSALSYTANAFILMILYDFCLSPAQVCYIIVHIRKVESSVQIVDRWLRKTHEKLRWEQSVCQPSFEPRAFRTQVRSITDWPTYAVKGRTYFKLFPLCFLLRSLAGVKWTFVLFYSDMIHDREGLWTGRPGFDSWHCKIFLFSAASTLTLGSTQPPIQWIPRTISSGVKRPVREADHSPLSRCEDKNGGAIPPLPHIYSRRGA
jgi:hypothetical protein